MYELIGLLLAVGVAVFAVNYFRTQDTRVALLKALGAYLAIVVFLAFLAGTPFLALICLPLWIIPFLGPVVAAKTITAYMNLWKRTMHSLGAPFNWAWVSPQPAIPPDSFDGQLRDTAIDTAHNIRDIHDAGSSDGS
jgi:hypothetical protein